MSAAMLVLVCVLFVSLFLIPIGLPGTWFMVIAAWGYNYLVEGDPVGTVTIIGTAILALVAEGLEFSLAAKFTRKYGGSKRAGWGAILGGVVGAMIGIPIPLFGPIIGAFLGTFAGAWVFEKSRNVEGENATRVATGALIGRIAASALKVSIAMVMLVWIVISALR